MSVKPFEQLYEIYDDATGDLLEWTWDVDLCALVATDEKGNTYKLTPITAELEVERVESDDEDEDEDYDDYE